MIDQHDGACLALADVSKSFGGLQALERVSLTVRGGERRAIIGPNGAGKTTLFNVISGELPVTAGRVLLFGQDITRLPPYRRCAMGLGRTFQLTNLFPSLTVEENVLLALLGTRRDKLIPHRPLAAYGSLFERARGLLERIGLWDKHALPIASLSYGEQRQIEVTLALASGPRLLLLDEPTAGLAPGEVKVLTAIIRSLDPSITVMLIEHDMDVAFEVAERITVLHLGRVIADGARDEIRANPEVQHIYLGVEG
jgi:branched-chain amino acid transport system ATP-binding protein